jgi:hypothetical protein
MQSIRRFVKIIDLSLVFLLCTIIIIGNISAQESTKFEWGFEGQISATTDSKGVFVNFGGPGLKLKTKFINVSLNMMPSLRFQEDGTKPFVTPILGGGPQLYFLKKKKLILSFPAYYYSSTQKWVFTTGLGYVITTSK